MATPQCALWASEDAFDLVMTMSRQAQLQPDLAQAI